MTSETVVTHINGKMEEFTALGEKTLDTGVKLHGKAPRVGKDAYLHTVYPALSAGDIESLETAIGRKIPANLVELYKESNGLNYFIDTFSIYGLRKTTGTGVSAAFQPYDLATPNVDERIADATDDMVFFGFYDWDGSLLYVRPDDERVYFCSRNSAQPLKTWSSMQEMLFEESERIANLFDSKGRELDSSKSTLPV